MKIDCPTCHKPIPTDAVNVAANVAFCKSCDEGFPLSGILNNAVEPPPDVDVNSPPSGVRYAETSGGVVITASTRSPLAFFLVPFMCVWSGGSLGGIYGSQIASGKFNLFMSLFGIPFALGTLFFGSFALMTVIGKIEIVLQGDDGKIFTGIGPFGFSKMFKFSEISRVYEKTSTGQKNNSTSIVLEGKDRIVFGSMLSEKRRYFLLQVLKKMIRPGDRSILQ